MGEFATTDDGRPFLDSGRETVAVAPSGIGFDWAMVLLSTVFVGGLFLDGWAHNHGRVDESFFTPWHGFFYAGYVAVAALLVAVILVNRRRGATWQQAIPSGYGLSLLGLAVFGAGGIGDLIWHELFGIEESLEALLSPTHMLLGAGIILIASGPLRAGWQRPSAPRSWRHQGPVILSTALVLSVLTFFTLYAHPLATPFGGRGHHMLRDEVGQGYSILSIYLFSALLAGSGLLLAWRWRLVAGTWTALLILNGIGMALVDLHHGYWWVLLWAQILAGVVADLMYIGLRPGREQVGRLRLFGASLPAVYFALHFLAVAQTEGLAWSIHMWAGAIVQAAMVGLLISLLIAPPATPDLGGV